MSSDSQFGAGLGYGIAPMRDDISGDCGRPVASNSDTFTRSYEAENPDWGNGFRTGQQLAYYIELSGRLTNCYIELPERDVDFD